MVRWGCCTSYFWPTGGKMKVGDLVKVWFDYGNQIGFGLVIKITKAWLDDDNSSDLVKILWKDGEIILRKNILGKCL